MIRLAGALLVLLSGAAGAGDGISSTTVLADSPQALQARLVSMAQERLQPTGLLLDGSRARMSLSGKLPADANLFEVRAAWPTGVRIPPLPLAFMVRAGSATWVRASLAIPVRQRVLVAHRSLPKGSSVSCDDLAMEYRDLRDVPTEPLGVPCRLGPEEVALRYLGKQDVIRKLDVGAAPVVAAGMPIAVTTLAGGISVTATGIALADAMIGDRIEVRMTGPTRTRYVRVTGNGTAKLEGFE